jgi:divinyl protochlorophyllide a 8-vinyl-reductase
VVGASSMSGMAVAALHASAARIGPNAITRVAEVLALRQGWGRTRIVFEHAGLLHHLLQPPQKMVDVADVRALHDSLRAELGEAACHELTREAGLRTANYLLENRIPKPLQAVLRHLPARLAAAVLLSAIRRHAWTFVGGGEFRAGVNWGAGAAVWLTLRDSPLCLDLHVQAPACDFHAATFQGLFAALVHKGSVVREVACQACGAEACRFEVRW